MDSHWKEINIPPYNPNDSRESRLVGAFSVRTVSVCNFFNISSVNDTFLITFLLGGNIKMTLQKVQDNTIFVDSENIYF